MTFDQIIKVDIAISEAMAIDGGYDTILIIGPLPKTPGGHMTPDVAGYTGTQDLKSAGFSTDDPVYIAASKVFAQSPKATMVMVAVQKTTSGSAEKVDVTLDRAKAVPGWYCICPAGIKEDFYQSIADWTESNEKFCVCETTGISASPVSDAMFRTAVIHATKENDCVPMFTFILLRMSSAQSAPICRAALQVITVSLLRRRVTVSPMRRAPMAKS